MAEHISIHAPLTGCDPGAAPSFRGAKEFQSTHPSRGATSSALTMFPANRFQSTHPSRGATILCSRHTQQRRISIHAPLTGCDLYHTGTSRWGPFQSTHPSRGATLISFWREIGPHGISIHAPLTGCDGKNCRFEQQFLRLGSRWSSSVRPSANQTGTAQKFIFCVPSAVRGGREFPDRFPFARFRSLRPSAGR